MGVRFDFVDKARAFQDVDAQRLVDVDPDLAELVESAQRASAIRLCKEAYTWERYEVRRFEERLFRRDEWVRVWLRATEVGVTCFAIEVSRRGRRNYENPLAWL